MLRGLQEIFELVNTDGPEGIVAKMELLDTKRANSIDQDLQSWWQSRFIPRREHVAEISTLEGSVRVLLYQFTDVLARAQVIGVTAANDLLKAVLVLRLFEILDEVLFVVEKLEFGTNRQRLILVLKRGVAGA